MSRPIKKSERGAVLLTTLLVMTLMAAIAVEMLDDVRFGVRRTANIQAAAQADAYAQAAQDFAKTYLEAQLATAEPAQLTQFLKTRPTAVLPFEGGTMMLTLSDRGSCISLGAIENASGRRQFRRLLLALGSDPQVAANLTSAVADWVDADSQALPGGAEDYAYLAEEPPYRTANTAMLSITELRAVSGMDEPLYQKLRPFICARDAGETRVNVNGLLPAQAPVLAAMLGDNALPAARMALDTPGAAYTAQTFAESPAMQGVTLNDADINALRYETNLIGIDARIVYQNIQRVVTMEFEISNRRAAQLSRRYGDENRYVPAPVLNSGNPETPR